MERGTVECPVCGESVPMGLPRSATVEAVREAPPDDVDPEPRVKWRPNECGDGHEFYVRFGF